MTIKVNGLEGLLGQLNELGDELTQQKKLRSAARKAFKPVQEAAKAKAPVDTGVLRDSIVIASANPKESVVAVGLVIKKGSADDPRKDASWRWHFPEKGTRKMAARPFLRPALDSNAETVVNNFADEMKKAIDRATKKKGGK